MKPFLFIPFFFVIACSSELDDPSKKGEVTTKNTNLDVIPPYNVFNNQTDTVITLPKGTKLFF